MAISSQQTWDQFNSGIVIAYLKKNGIHKFGMGIEVCYKKIKPTNYFF